MGNRAVITTQENFDNNGVGIYLHWNGGRDSVEAFLTYCKLKGYRPPSRDNYGWARLCQVIGNFFGGSTSVGIDVINNLDCNNGDNGVYIIKDWEIVDRKYIRSREQDSHGLQEMLEAIDDSMPFEEQLGDFLKAETVKTSDLKLGDIVYEFDPFLCKYESHKVVGFGKNGRTINCRNVSGVPFVDIYGEETSSFGIDYSSNSNNYLFEQEYQVAKRA